MISKINLTDKFSTFTNLNQTVLKQPLFFTSKNKSIPLVEYTAVNTFRWNVQDEINVLFENDLTEK